MDLRVGVVVVSIGLVSCAVAAVPEFDMAGNPLRCDDSGRVRSMWGYSVAIPGALQGCRHNAHDVLIPLAGRADDRVVSCYGFLASDDATLQSDVDDFIRSLKESKEYLRLEVLGRRATTLGNTLQAERVLVRYEKPGSARKMMLDYVGAVASDSCASTGNTERAFSVYLETRATAYKIDKVVLEEVLMGWRCEPDSR